METGEALMIQVVLMAARLLLTRHGTMWPIHTVVSGANSLQICCSCLVDLEPSLLDDWTSLEQSTNAFLDMDMGETAWPGGLPLL